MTRSRAAKSRRTHVGLEQRFVASIRALELRPEQPIVVGFSGGKDSLALAQLFARTKTITGVEARLLHVNHNLRPTSADEMVQALALAKQLGLPVSVTEIEPDVVHRHPGLGVEEAARRERFFALKDFAHKWRTDVLALAHQQQDQAETVLLHLLRGAGISGMQAMSTLSKVHIPWWEGATDAKPFRVWRPLLDEDPEELVGYLRLHGLSPIDDPSNDEPYYLRNRIRHDILPALEALQPKAQESISRFANIAALEDALLSASTDEAIRSLVRDRIKIDRLEAQHTHPVILRRLFRWAIESAGATDVRFDRVKQVVSLVNEEPADRVMELGDGVIAVSDRSWIYLGKQQEIADLIQSMHKVWLLPADWTEDQQLQIPLEAPVTIDGVTIHASADTARSEKHGPCRASLPIEAVDCTFVLRKVQRGDVWARTKDTIREQLRITGIPPFARSRLMVFASDQGVWLIPGVARPSGKTMDLKKSIVFLEIEGMK